MRRLLTVAGSDSGGGAGIQADLKTFEALGAYGMSAITAITAQNTLGVSGVWPVPPDAVVAQMEAVASDIGVDAIKIGMLHNAEVIKAVARVLRHWPPLPIVLDPVMRAKGGQPLLLKEAESLLVEQLLPLATVVTPNMPEAEAMTGLLIRDVTEQREAARRLISQGCQWALVKGGHANDADVTDILGGDTIVTFTHPRIDTRHTHGTGCTLSSAIAVGLARGLSVPESVSMAETYVQGAIRRAPGLGSGHGPLGHHGPQEPCS